MNICSVIVHCKPENANLVKNNLEQRQGIDVYGGVEQGKIITTIEASGERALSDIMEEFNHIPGVIDTAMVYHQEEDDDNLEKLV